MNRRTLWIVVLVVALFPTVTLADGSLSSSWFGFGGCVSEPDGEVHDITDSTALCWVGDDRNTATQLGLMFDSWVQPGSSTKFAVRIRKGATGRFFVGEFTIEPNVETLRRGTESAVAEVLRGFKETYLQVTGEQVQISYYTVHLGKEPLAKVAFAYTVVDQ